MGSVYDWTFVTEYQIYKKEEQQRNMLLWDKYIALTKLRSVLLGNVGGKVESRDSQILFPQGNDALRNYLFKARNISISIQAQSLD